MVVDPTIVPIIKIIGFVVCVAGWLCFARFLHLPPLEIPYRFYRRMHGLPRVLASICVLSIILTISAVVIWCGNGSRCYKVTFGVELTSLILRYLTMLVCWIYISQTLCDHVFCRPLSIRDTLIVSIVLPITVPSVIWLAATL